MVKHKLTRILRRAPKLALIYMYIALNMWLE